MQQLGELTGVAGLSEFERGSARSDDPKRLWHDPRHLGTHYPGRGALPQIINRQLPTAAFQMGGSAKFGRNDSLRRSSWRGAGRNGSAYPPNLSSRRRRGNQFRYQALAVFIQIIDHGIEHRTNITTILNQGLLTPPDVDGWGYLNAHPDRFELK